MTCGGTSCALRQPACPPHIARCVPGPWGPGRSIPGPDCQGLRLTQQGRGAQHRGQEGQTRAALLTRWVPEQAASPHPNLSFPACELGQRHAETNAVTGVGISIAPLLIGCPA